MPNGVGEFFILRKGENLTKFYVHDIIHMKGGDCIMLEIIMSIENEEDRTFMETLYYDYSERMYLTAMNVLNNHHDAQDCVHETIARIINENKIDKFRNAKNKNYLVNLIVISTRNNAINIYNKNHKRNINVFSTTVYDEDGDNWDIMDIPDTENDVQKIIISEETCKIMHDLINKLDFVYRDVIVLMQMGYSYENIADILGITVEAVRKRYSRARAKLREMGGKDLYV